MLCKGKEATVLITDMPCPFCQTEVGFFACRGGNIVVLMYDECEAIWLDPIEVDRQHALWPEQAEFSIPGMKQLLSLDDAQWARQAKWSNRDGLYM
jgi:hypothetical protein